MNNEVKPLLKTLKYRVKDRTSGKKLDVAARAVNFVWNHCNAMQVHALRHNQKWPAAAAFQGSTKGAGKEIGLPAQCVQEKSAADASTGMSRTMLRYKAIARGALYVDVSEAFTTQTCSDCGSIGGPKGTKGLEIREWRCDCGAVHDRDVNAARNILRLGHEALAEGSSLLSVS